MQRKPVIVITATITALMLAFGTTGGAMASTGATATGMPPLILNRASTPTYPQGAVVTVDGQPLDGFDPALGADDPATGAIEAKTYNVDGIVKLTGLPEGWTVQNDLREHATTGKTSAFYILSDGTRTYRWWFDGATGITHTVDELRGLTLTRNNTPITGVDTTRSQTLHGFAPSDLIGYENAPANWDCAQGDTENGDGYEYTFTPAGASQPSVTFTFLYDHETDDPADLKGVQAWLPDGSLVTGFDPTDTGTLYKIPNGTGTVTFTGLPEGWKISNQSGGASDRNISIELAGPNGNRINYLFTHAGDYTYTYSISQLKHVTAKADGKTVDGFGWQGGDFTIPHDAKQVTLDGIPEGWDSRTADTDGTVTVTVSSPDGNITAEYRFTRAAKPSSADDLQNVQAIVDGHPLEGFTPTRSSEYTIPAGSKPGLGNIPEGWTLGQSAGEDGTITFTLSKGTVTVTYTFRFEKPKPSTDDLKQVTAKADGQPVTGFDPTVSGEYTVPEDAKVTLDGLPEGWDVKHDKGTLTWTITSPDGNITVTYTFRYPEHAGSSDDLKQVTVTYEDGTPVTGFDPTVSGEWKVVKGTTRLKIDNIPSGWESTPLDGKLGWTLTSPDGKLTVTYMFTVQDAPTAKQHTVTFDYAHDGKTTSMKTDDGKPVGQPKDPAREGYEFAGWTLDGKPYDFGTPVTRDLTLKAMWEKTDEPATAIHTIRFTTGNSPDTTITVKDGQTVPRPKDPTRDGWKFTGWYAAGADTPYDFTRPVITDLTLTARWEKTGGQLPGDTNRDGRYTTDDLTALTATQGNEPYKAFSHTIHSYTGLTDPHSVLLHNLPDGWKLASSTTATGVTWRVTAPDGTTVTTYRFSGTATTAGASGEEQQDGRKPGQSAPIIRQSDTILSRTGANTTAAILLAVSMLMGGITALLTKRRRNGRSH